MTAALRPSALAAIALTLTLATACEKEPAPVVQTCAGPMRWVGPGSTDCECDESRGSIPYYDGRACLRTDDLGDELWWHLYFLDPVPYLPVDTLLVRFANDRDTASFRHGSHASIGNPIYKIDPRPEGQPAITFVTQEKCREAFARAQRGDYSEIGGHHNPFYGARDPGLSMRPQLGFDPQMPPGQFIEFGSHITDVDDDCIGEQNLFRGTVRDDGVLVGVMTGTEPNYKETDTGRGYVYLPIGEYRFEARRLPQPYRPTAGQ